MKTENRNNKTQRKTGSTYVIFTFFWKAHLRIFFGNTPVFFHFF